MGLNVPELDDRTFEQLLEGARRSIPVHTDEWTDHNASDPGITILETLAWVAESDIYRLDRVTDAHLRKYLQLLGVRPRPPQPASARVTLDPAEDAVGKTIRAGAELVAETPSGEVTSFTTTTSVPVAGVDVATVVSDHRSGQVDNTGANRTPEMYYQAFGPGAELGSTMYVGFDDDPFEAANRLDLYVDYHDENLPDPATHGPGDVDPVAEVGPGGFHDDATRGGGACGDAAGGEQADEVGEDPPSGATADPARSEAGATDDGPDVASLVGALPEFEPSVEVEWQHCTDVEHWFEDGNWEPVPVHRDETNRFYRGGTISLCEPDDWASESGPILDVDASRYWLRCVVTSPGYEVPPQLNGLHTNVVPVRNCAERVGERLSRPDGDAATTARPDQRFVFERSPVQSATIRVGGERWTEVSDFAASGPDDNHYVLDRSAGAIRFGDGVRGAVPEPGLPVVAERYVHGGGPGGNVSPSASWRFADEGLADVGVQPRTRPSGGTEAESLDAALARLKRDLKRPYRLVTREDCEYVAEHTPGVRFGRTSVRVEEAGDADGCAAHGDLRVVVVPYSTRPRPEPSDGFMEAVRCHLERHRLLTDRVTVVPPEYVGVGVEAVVELQSGFARRQRIDAVESALDEFLDPLTGFDGDGWPFGRPVFPSELYETIGNVAGIDCVHDVAIDARGDYEFDGGTVEIGDQALVYPLAHEVRVGTEGDRCRRWDR